MAAFFSNPTQNHGDVSPFPIRAKDPGEATIFRSNADFYSLFFKKILQLCRLIWKWEKMIPYGLGR